MTIKRVVNSTDKIRRPQASTPNKKIEKPIKQME